MLFKDWISVKIRMNEIIINASVKDGSDSFVDHPIGLCYYFLTSNMKDAFLNHPNINTECCLCSMNLSTDRYRRSKSQINRRSIANTLLHKKFIQNMRGTPDNYYSDIGKYQFVICPEGNGIDTHRLWEALYSKGIPIVEYNELMAQKLEGLPILWTKDYSELSESYLKQEYKRILESEYDFSKLYLSEYSEHEIRLILDRSKKWCHKFKQHNEFQEYSDSVLKCAGLKAN
jgi:hypothetical protein